VPEALDMLAQLPIAVLLRQSDWAYPLTSATHIFSLGLIIGAGHCLPTPFILLCV